MSCDLIKSQKLKKKLIIVKRNCINLNKYLKKNVNDEECITVCTREKYKYLQYIFLRLQKIVNTVFFIYKYI